jgi:DNA-binding transcriptional LysR family regulator
MSQLIISKKETMKTLVSPSDISRADLELVLAVRAQASLSGAALQLDMAPPAVTKRLAALEARLGQKLFLRTTRRISVTAEGEIVCQRASALLQGFKDLESQLRERQHEPTGRIRLASTFGFGRLWLGPALAQFQQRYPKLVIQLELTEQLPDLAEQGFDGAVWLWSVSSVQAAKWVSRRLAQNQRVLVAAPDYLRRNGSPKTPQELEHHDCLVVRENGQASGQFDHWRLKRQSDKRSLEEQTSVRVKGPLSSNSGEMARDWCLSGHGILLRSLWDIAPQLAEGKLQRVLPAWSMPQADVAWLAPYRAEVPRRIRLLIDFLVAHFATEPWKAASKTKL